MAARSYTEVLKELDARIDFEKMTSGRFDPPDLGRMQALSGVLGDPPRAAPVIHVTGTNGKGSTARMTTALLAASGLSVGTYTSPDLGRVNERISRNGEAIDDESFAEAVGAVLELEALSGVSATWFELLTLTAFWWFSDVAVDAMVLEVGWGGRFDATNVADATVAVVTNVGLDHTAVLGPTRAHIAAEKAGIVKLGSTLILGETDPELQAILEAPGPAIIERRGSDFGCSANDTAVGGRALDLFTPGRSYDAVFLPLHGAHQGDNAACALAAANAFFSEPMADEVVRGALAGVTVPGRFEVVGRAPLVVLDGAHNPDGARAAAATLDDFAPGGDRLLVVGVMHDRDPLEMLEALEARSARLVIACAADWPKALPAMDVGAAARQLGIDTEVVPHVAEAVRRARALASTEDLILVTGSLYVVGAARSALVPS